MREDTPLTFEPVCIYVAKLALLESKQRNKENNKKYMQCFYFVKFLFNFSFMMDPKG